MSIPPGARETNGPAEVWVALLRAAQKNAVATVLVQVAAAASMPFVGRPEMRGWYLAWLAVTLSVAVTRVAVDQVLRRTLSEAAEDGGGRLRPWAFAHSAGLLTSAGLWALLAWTQLPAETPQTRFIILIIVSALAAGAIGVLAPLRLTGRLYVTLMLLPACGRLMLEGQSILGVLGLVFWGVMVAGHGNNHALLRRSIALGRENLDLVAQLTARNEEIEQINQSLEQRVAARTEALKILAVEAQAGSRAKSEFLATISHEIRTPLNGVLGMAQVMDRGDLSGEQRDRLSIIQASARALLAVVNDVLDISKIEAGNLTIAPVPFRLDHLADGVRQLYSVLAQEKGLAFDLVLSNSAPGWRLGDEARLRQILSNLISNALKFTEAGSVRVEIAGDDKGVVIQVRDTGVGIALADQSHIFERFVQADGSSTRRAGGTGLGLAICRELAGLMGGEISLASAPGEGSCFTVALPMPTSGENGAQASEAPAPGVRRILVVDDNPTNRFVLQTMLEDYGLSSGMAHDGLEAVTAWEDGDWDAILMDIRMPRMDGLDATRAIRAGESRGNRPRTPIIAVTASAHPREAEAYRAAGMDDVVAKPVDAQTLMDVLGRQKVTVPAA